MIQETKCCHLLCVEEFPLYSSVTAAGHFLGTGVTVLQFPSEENRGIQREQKTFKELHSVVPQSCESLKTITRVNKINDKLEFHYCAETVNVPIF